MWRYPTLSSNPIIAKKHKNVKIQKFDVALCGAIRRYPQTQNFAKKRKFSNFRTWTWHYVALCGAIRRYPRTQNFTKKRKIFKFQNLDVALCGAMWRYPTLSSNPRFYKKHKINQNYKISEFGCGTVWHYLTSSSNPKYCKKSTQIQFQHPASKLLSKKHMPEFQKMENSNLALQCKISNWIWPRCSYELVVAGLLP
jgi:hypothetical protein